MQVIIFWKKAYSLAQEWRLDGFHELSGKWQRGLRTMPHRDPKYNETKTKTCDMSRVLRDHPRCRSATWICMYGHTSDIVIYSRFHQNLFGGFGATGTQFALFRYFGYKSWYIGFYVKLQERYQQLICQGKRQINTSETGGWCDTAVRKGHSTDVQLVSALAELFSGQTVVALGDGNGEYRKLILQTGRVKSYDSYDGAPNINNITGGKVLFTLYCVLLMCYCNLHSHSITVILSFFSYCFIFLSLFNIHMFIVLNFTGI